MILSWKSHSYLPSGNGRKISIRSQFIQKPWLTTYFLWTLLLLFVCLAKHLLLMFLLKLVLHKQLAIASIVVRISQNLIQIIHSKLFDPRLLGLPSFQLRSSSQGSYGQMELLLPSCHQGSIVSTALNSFDLMVAFHNFDSKDHYFNSFNCFNQLSYLLISHSNWNFEY